MLVEAQFYDDLIPEFQEAKEALTSALGSVCDFFDAAVKILEDKKGRMFEHVPLDIETPSVDARAAKKLNAVIRQHNQRCVDFDAKVEDARGKLAADMIAEALDEFGRRSKKKHDAKTELERAEQEVQQLLSKITKLENEIVEHLQPVNELNRDLRNYLGHTELRLEIKDTGYAITRGGMPAKSLSEGETTAIALLYFLKSLKDNRFDFEKGVIVLDDPVSSLDANALFTAHAFMRQRCENTRQLFILTHNFSFFRQVRNWFAHMKGQRSNNNIDKRPARLYMLESVFEDGARSSTVRGLDPLLENYNSEYHYLFALVYRASKLAERRLERNYFLPNVARRVLEIFFDFRQPNILGSLRKKLQNVSFDEEKKFRILRFLHTHSHSLGMEDPGHDLTALTEAPSILKDLLELIESEDSKHYKAMEELLGVLPTDSGEVREGATTV